MTDTVTTAPDTATTIRVLRSAAARVAGHRAPHLLLPDIAHRHDLTIDVVRDIVTRHGWPRPASMNRAIDILEAGANPATTGPSTGPSVHPLADGATLMHLPPNRLHPDPANVRLDLGDLTELAASISELGILQPIVARATGSRLTIVMGHRRHAAATRLGLSTIPVIVRTDLEPDDVLAAMLVENSQRRDLDPIEEARALTRLKAAERLTDHDLARRICRSQAHVSNRLALVHLTTEQQAAVRAGLLPLNRAIKLARNQGGITSPGAAGKKSAAHLTWHHPLAQAVADLCEKREHGKHKPGRVGGVACGTCWEDEIRADERARLEEDRA